MPMKRKKIQNNDLLSIYNINKQELIAILAKKQNTILTLDFHLKKLKI